MDDDDDQLSPLDRCDRCPQPAYVRAHLAYGQLLFCGHHARLALPGLTKAGARIHNELARLDLEHGPAREMAGDHA